MQFLMPLILLLLLIGRPEQQIHHQNLIGDQDRHEENRIVLRFLCEFTNKFQQKGAIVDDFSKQHDLVHHQYRKLTVGIAQQRVVQGCKQILSNVQTTARVFHVKIFSVLDFMWNFVFTAEDIEEEDADEDDEGPWDEEFDLRPVEEERNNLLKFDLHDNEDEGAESECSHADGFEGSGGYAPAVPAEVIAESPEEKQGDVKHHQADAEGGEIGVAHNSAIYTNSRSKARNNSQSPLFNSVSNHQLLKRS